MRVFRIVACKGCVAGHVGWTWLGFRALSVLVRKGGVVVCRYGIELVVERYAEAHATDVMAGAFACAYELKPRIAHCFRGLSWGYL